MTTESERIGARQRFRQLLEQVTDEHPEMNSGEIADYVARTLPATDLSLVEEFLASEARAILAMVVLRHHAQTRHGIFTTIGIQNPTAPPVAKLSEKRQQTLYERIEAWREYVPAERRSKPLGSMTRPMLRDSAEYDIAKVYHFGFKSLLKQRLADALPDDETTVSEMFTSTEIAELTERVKKDMSRGNFRLRIKPVHSLPR